jgi:hypothetical protein
VSRIGKQRERVRREAENALEDDERPVQACADGEGGAKILRGVGMPRMTVVMIIVIVGMTVGHNAA